MIFRAMAGGRSDQPVINGQTNSLRFETHSSLLNWWIRIMTSRRMTSLLICIVCVAITSCARVRGFSARFSSVETLTEMLGDEQNYSTQLGGSSSTPSADAYVALVRKGTNSVMPLIEVLQHSTNSLVRQNAAVVLGSIRDHRAVEPLIAALKDHDANVRACAAGALYEMADSRSIEPLIEALKDSDVRVQGQAAVALGKFTSDPRILDVMIQLMKDNGSSMAVVILGEIQDPRALQAIISGYKELHDYLSREAALKVLAEKRDPQGVPIIIQATEDENFRVRDTAAWALGRYFTRDPRIVEPLIRLLKDEYKIVHDSANRALEERKRLGLENNAQPTQPVP